MALVFLKIILIYGRYVMHHFHIRAIAWQRRKMRTRTYVNTALESESKKYECRNEHHTNVWRAVYVDPRTRMFCLNFGVRVTNLFNYVVLSLEINVAIVNRKKPSYMSSLQISLLQILHMFFSNRPTFRVLYRSDGNGRLNVVFFQICSNGEKLRTLCLLLN